MRHEIVHNGYCNNDGQSKKIPRSEFSKYLRYCRYLSELIKNCDEIVCNNNI